MCFVVVCASAKQKYTLVIDAGHGGKDAGACSGKAKEKVINLNVALAFGRYVEQNCPDVRVIYTRKNDRFIPLHERAAIANRNKADVFISIHTNSVASKKPIRGMETYTMGIRRSDEKLSAAKRENEVILIEDDYKQHYSGYDPRSPESTLIFEVINEQNMMKSVELASMIQKYTCSVAGRPDKGVRQDAFLVLRETSMPACLIELGYITTPSEVKYLYNKRNVDLMGYGIYQAFVAFKNKQTGKAVSMPQPSSRPVTDEQPQEVAQSKKVSQPVPVTLPVEPAQKKSKAEEKPVQKKQEGKAEQQAADVTVFKVQFLASNTKMKASDKRLKDVKDFDCYKEDGMWKYTIGASADYNEIYRLRKGILDKFPQAFIIAYRNGEKIDAGKAYQEFKSKKK